ncbi:MAG: hypothetical protein Q8R92_15930 [Deltaproteobacteria bacterium]|nr:hypothetical protein [Deltaproteobacteria bacterium]
MLHYWEELDDEQDDEGEEWKHGAREAAASDGETVERFLAEIDVALYDRNGNAVSCPEEPAAWQLALCSGADSAGVSATGSTVGTLASSHGGRASVRAGASSGARSARRRGARRAGDRAAWRREAVDDRRPHHPFRHRRAAGLDRRELPCWPQRAHPTRLPAGPS